MKFLFLLFVWFQSLIALAQEMVGPPAPPEGVDPGLLDLVLGFMASMVHATPQIIAAMTTIWLVCRLGSELLLLISKKTETKADDKLYEIISNVSWILGVWLSKPGWATPKVVALEQANKILGVDDAKKIVDGFLAGGKSPAGKSDGADGKPQA